MKTYQACIPCITNLLESSLEISDLDSAARNALITKLETDLSRTDMTFPPARTAGAIYQSVLQETGQEDLFKDFKRKSIQEALEFYPLLSRFVKGAEDSLEAAIKISALGNTLDVANPSEVGLDQELSLLMDHQLQGDALDLFRAKLGSASYLLILGDNAGETVFDKALIETLELPVVYAVKSGPAYDDALLEDALQAGLNRVAEVIETGTSFPGTYLPSCSSEFREQFLEAPLVLSKGQANYETLSNHAREIFFLLKIKCQVVSQEIGYPLGSLTLNHHRGNNSS
jgi:uncharacterized protein with ATP-grasp and redox domains